MELRRNHKIELDRLRQEKDELLKEEAMATQAGGRCAWHILKSRDLSVFVFSLHIVVLASVFTVQVCWFCM